MVFSIGFCIYQRFIGTIQYTGRDIPAGTEIAFNNSLIIHIATECPIGAGYHACPTTNTFLHINANHASYRVSTHRAGKTGINTPGLVALATLDWKGNLYIPIDMHTG